LVISYMCSPNDSRMPDKHLMLAYGSYGEMEQDVPMMHT
jgi:hypothetical protein